MNLWQLYQQMLRSRMFEEAVITLWNKGLISGEMHLGLGEEAIVAATVCQLQDGDALALDHRGTPPLVMRGVELVSLLREFLGCADGLCGGSGGHMHLFSPENLAASSGIVGSSAPTAVGFALSAEHLRPGKVAIAYFGEGAMNQGMVMEALNLAVVWDLPVLFVCKDNGWSITTRTPDVMSGDLLGRASSLGLLAFEVDGTDVEAVWNVAKQGLTRARHGNGPSFLLAHCAHLEGHFLGDPLLRITRQPIKGFAPYAGPLIRAASTRSGGSVSDRMASLKTVIRLMRQMVNDHRTKKLDPVAHLRRKLIGQKTRLEQIERDVTQEIEIAVAVALTGLKGE